MFFIDSVTLLFVLIIIQFLFLYANSRYAFLCLPVSSGLTSCFLLWIFSTDASRIIYRSGLGINLPTTLTNFVQPPGLVAMDPETPHDSVALVKRHANGGISII